MLKVKPEVEVNWSVMIDSSCKLTFFRSYMAVLCLLQRSLFWQIIFFYFLLFAGYIRCFGGKRSARRTWIDGMIIPMSFEG